MKCPPGTVKATRTIPSKKTGGSPKVETYCKVIGGTKDKKGPKSPMKKKLVGDQHKLPEHLKAKIKAAPEMKGSPYMMYGKKSSKLEGGSPLAKYGCSKKHKK